MKNQLQVFKNEQFREIRTLVQNGEPWFVGKDIAENLGYTDAEAMCRRIDKEDQSIMTSQNLQNVGFEIPTRGLKIINESGLYSAILGSKKPTAKQFKHWVTSEVLPQIRKTGSYTQNQSPEDKQKLAEARLRNAKAREASILYKIANSIDTNKTYRQVLYSYAAATIAGKPILPLPKVEEETLSAEEVGKECGISANMVGKIARANNLKTEKYGGWYHDKSKYSNKEVETFRYFRSVIPVIKGILNKEEKKNAK